MGRIVGSDPWKSVLFDMFCAAPLDPFPTRVDDPNIFVVVDDGIVVAPLMCVPKPAKLMSPNGCDAICGWWPKEEVVPINVGGSSSHPSPSSEPSGGFEKKS